MHASDRAFAAIVGDVTLGDDRLQAVGLEFVLAECPGEIAARVLLAVEIDDKRTLELGLREDQLGLLCLHLRDGIQPESRTFLA